MKIQFPSLRFNECKKQLIGTGLPKWFAIGNDATHCIIPCDSVAQSAAEVSVQYDARPPKSPLHLPYFHRDPRQSGEVQMQYVVAATRKLGVACK
eukprot:m.13170 g.13170  ORF g.13170 m.13170 type:complete len:95 (+) comp5905_c0_seq2:316-600(+)